MTKFNKICSENKIFISVLDGVKLLKRHTSNIPGEIFKMNILKNVVIYQSLQ